MTKSFRMPGPFLPLMIALVFLCVPSYSQFNSTIEGIVTDTSGSPIPDCAVTLKDLGTGIEKKATTGSAGDYTFPTLAPGRYTITAVATGFQTFVQENITLQASSVIRVPVKLTVGSVATTVDVTAEPLPIQTDESKISAVVTDREINELPLAERNVLNVVTLTPGVVGTGMMGGTAQGVMVANQFPAISANGPPNSSNEFYVDGTTVNDSPSSGDARIVVNPDAVSEVVVSANEFAAQYGRGSGVVVQMITKSGTNQLHGSLFELLQNSWLNARNEFQNTVNPVTRHVIPPSRLNEFGGVFWRTYLERPYVLLCQSGQDDTVGCIPECCPGRNPAISQLHGSKLSEQPFHDAIEVISAQRRAFIQLPNGDPDNAIPIRANVYRCRASRSALQSPYACNRDP